MSETTSKPRKEIERPHMAPQGVSHGSHGVYVGSLMGYKKYVLYVVHDGAFEPVVTIDTPEEAARVADLLGMAAKIGASRANNAHANPSAREASDD